jgi:hypothetical protein
LKIVNWNLTGNARTGNECPAGVANDDIEASEFCLNLADHRADLSLVCRISLDPDRPAIQCPDFIDDRLASRCQWFVVAPVRSQVQVIDDNIGP